MADWGEGAHFGRFPACTSDEERFARLRLARTHRIGPVHFHQLTLRFGSAAKAVENLPLIAKRAGGGIVAAPAEAVEAEIARGRAAGARLVIAASALSAPVLANARPMLSLATFARRSIWRLSRSTTPFALAKLRSSPRISALSCSSRASLSRAMGYPG